MNSFLRHIFKLTILFSLCIGVLFIINNKKISQLINISKSQNIYFNPLFKQSIIDFKLKQKKTDISIIGSSRTSGFEKEMFLNKSIYNYSMIINSIQDAFSLIKDLDLEKKDTIIIGLDQWNFNKNYLGRLSDKYKRNNLNLPFILFDKFIRFDSVSLIGDKAIKNFSGFRDDGSYFHGKRFVISKDQLEDYNFMDTKKRIKDGNRRFEYGSEIDFKQLKKVEDILLFCKKREIVVIGFFPPFALSIYNMMNSSKYDYGYLDKSSIEISNLFNKHNYLFKDFTKLDAFEDKYYLDGFHCNRNVYYFILGELGLNVNKSFINDFEVESNEFFYLKNYFN
jgi:hypothetical protein